MMSDHDEDLQDDSFDKEPEEGEKFLDDEASEETAVEADDQADDDGMADAGLSEEPMFESPAMPDDMEGPPMPPPTNFDYAYPQLFFFMFSCLAIFIGCLLPWERTYLTGNLTGADSIGGGFLICFSLYGVISGFFNIYHRKMIVWPVILSAIDGAVIGWQRVVQIVSKIDKNQFITTDDDFGKVVQTVKGYVQSLGPGLYLVTIFSTLILFSIILSVFKGAKEDSKRKAAERDARMEARKSRRG
jgi:hypothetical protein